MDQDTIDLIVSLKNEIETLRAQVKNLPDSITITQSLTALEEEIDTLDKKLATLESVDSSLQDQINEIKIFTHINDL